MKTLRNLALGAALAVAFGTSAMAMDKVRIGTTPESYPPFTQIEADGSVSGFEAEIADALCAKMEVECEWVLQAWDGIIPALQANKFDAIIASMSITDKRKEVIDFSNKYYNTPAMFVGPKDKDVTISAEGLSGVTVGVQTATTHAAQDGRPAQFGARHGEADEQAKCVGAKRDLDRDQRPGQQRFAPGPLTEAEQGDEFTHSPAPADPWPRASPQPP